MEKYRFAPLRDLLKREGVEQKVFALAMRMLGYWQEPPGGLWEAYQALMEARGDGREDLVAFTSYSLMDECYYPTFAVYKADDVRSSVPIVRDFEEIDPDSVTGLLKEGVWLKLVDMSPNAREVLLRKGRASLPVPVLWDAVSDPAGIHVNDIRVAAMVIAAALRDRWARSFGYFPLILGPGDEGETGPTALFEEISRYKVLFVGSVRLTIDRLLDEVEGSGDLEWDDMDLEDEENEE